MLNLPEDLSSNLRTHLKGKNIMTHAYNTAAEEVKDVDSGGSITNLTNQSRQLEAIRANDRL